MPEPQSHTSAGRYLVNLAALVVVVAGVKLALAMILSPAMHWLQQRRVPEGLAVLIVIGVFGLLAVCVAVLLGASVQGFLGHLPAYSGRLEQRFEELTHTLERLHVVVPGDEPPEFLDPQVGVRLVGVMVSSLSGLFSQGLLILLTTAFLLFESAVFPQKLRVMLGEDNPVPERLRQILLGVRQYLAIKAWISLLTALLVTACLVFFDVAYPLLWGLLAFLLNFVPNIGSLIAAAPAVALAWLQHDLATAVYVALWYTAVNQVIGNVVEPRVMGRGLGLSTLVVFLSLVVWGWVLGPVGMILSVPLTMAFKITLENLEETRWIALLLGPVDQVRPLRPPVDEPRL